MARGEALIFESCLRRIEELTSALDRLADAGAREQARELVEAMLDLHGLALARILARVAQAEGGADAIEDLGQDEQVKGVLLMHGLHPQDLRERVLQVVESRRAALCDHGIDFELVDLSGGAARLRLRGFEEDGRAAAALIAESEDALLQAAPDLDEVEATLEDCAAPTPILSTASAG